MSCIYFKGKDINKNASVFIQTWTFEKATNENVVLCSLKRTEPIIQWIKQRIPNQVKSNQIKVSSSKIPISNDLSLSATFSLTSKFPIIFPKFEPTFFGNNLPNKETIPSK